MDNPEKELTHIIHLLTQAPPSKQLAAINEYWTPTASITHPFVRTGSWTLDPWLEQLGVPKQHRGYNSRWLVARIYRWYKMMSPRVGSRVDGLAVEYEQSGDDDKNGSHVGEERRIRAAYATVRQTFGIFFWPFYRADVRLVVRMGITYDEADKKYYITSQEDCYPFHEFTRFIWFSVWRLVILLQIFGTLTCTALSYLVWPITRWADREQVGGAGELSANDWTTPQGNGLEVMGNHLVRKGKKDKVK